MEEHEKMKGEREQISSGKGDTWPKILKHNHEKYGDNRKAMRYKHYGIWRPYTWKDYYLNVKYLALGLLALDFEPGDSVLIMGDNAPHWYYAELAAQANHGASVGLYSDLTPSEIEYLAKKSEARFAVVQDQEQIDKFIEIKDKLPRLKKIVYWNYKGLAHYNDSALLGYSQVLQLGKKYEKDHPGLFEQNVESGKADDVCAIVYTSGTTEATPKAVVHTYRTMKAGADYLLQLDPWYENDNVVPYLPPAWMTEQWLGIGCHLLTASTLNFAEAPETQQRDTRETGPSIVCYGARLWESQAAMVHGRILGADALKRFAFRRLMPIGYKMAELKYENKQPGLFDKILYSLADIALFRPIKDSLGLRNARICYTTGSRLSPDAFRFYHALNLPLKSLYGTTEGGALTGARNDNIRLETVGPAHPGTEVIIADKGELIYRQPGVFIGYYKNPDKTSEVLKDGWFYSGDRGLITEDGHVEFLDRVKDYLELAGGEKLSPQLIESRLRFSPYIEDAWILAGPDRAYASAIIIINQSNVGKWAGHRKVGYTNFAALSQASEVYGLVRNDIDRVNSALPPGSRIKKYVNLHKEFDPDEAELTRNLKLRREFLEERYRGLIGAIYSDQTEAQVETRIRYRDGRMGTTKTTLRIKSVEGTDS